MAAAADHAAHRDCPGGDRRRLYGERGTGALLILSQVILSLQLPFAVFPLVSFTTDRHKMGEFIAPALGRVCWRGLWPLSLRR